MGLSTCPVFVLFLHIQNVKKYDRVQKHKKRKKLLTNLMPKKTDQNELVYLISHKFMHISHGGYHHNHKTYVN